MDVRVQPTHILSRNTRFIQKIAMVFPANRKIYSHCLHINPKYANIHYCRWKFIYTISRIHGLCQPASPSHQMYLRFGCMWYNSNPKPSTDWQKKKPLDLINFSVKHVASFAHKHTFSARVLFFCIAFSRSPTKPISDLSFHLTGFRLHRF